MRSLPDQFEEDDKENTSHESMTARADLHDEVTKSTKNKKTIFSVALFVALFSVVLNGVVIGVAVERPVEKFVALFGSEITATMSVADAQQESISQVQKLIAQHSIQLNSIAGSIKLLNEQLNDYKNELINTTGHEAQLERRYHELSADIELLKKPKLAPKLIVSTKPKEPVKKVLSVSLASIRIQGGELWVSLHEGFDSSPLLTLGDEWHGCKLIAADPLKKEVQLLINGVSTLVTL
jgi:septal ring factor EnvC (AmiA/AmiB activator)